MQSISCDSPVIQSLGDCESHRRIPEVHITLYSIYPLNIRHSVNIRYSPCHKISRHSI